MIRAILLCVIVGLVAGASSFNPAAASRPSKDAAGLKFSPNAPEYLFQAKEKADASIDGLRVGEYFWGKEITLDYLKEKVVLVQIAGL